MLLLPTSTPNIILQDTHTTTQNLILYSMLLIPFVSSFMVAVIIMGFNLAVVSTAMLIVFYAGHPLVNLLQHIHIRQQQFDAFLLLFYAVVIAVLVWKLESVKTDFDEFWRYIDQQLSSKNARIEELEMELKKRVVEEGPPYRPSCSSIATTHHRLCTPPIFERE